MDIDIDIDIDIGIPITPNAKTIVMHCHLFVSVISTARF